jgi:hypothetical protein
MSMCSLNRRQNNRKGRSSKENVFEAFASFSRKTHTTIKGVPIPNEIGPNRQTPAKKNPEKYQQMAFSSPTGNPKADRYWKGNEQDDAEKKKEEPGEIPAKSRHEERIAMKPEDGITG